MGDDVLAAEDDADHGADPAQQQMMMFMPIMFGFMFLRAPPALAIYWFVSNVWAIGQQYFTNWMIGPPAVATVRPPAERTAEERRCADKTDAAARTRIHERLCRPDHRRLPKFVQRVVTRWARN